MNQCIVTGFGPFSIYPVNSSWQACKALRQKRAECLIKELTVDHHAAHDEIVALLTENRCKTLLLSGLAANYYEIKLETEAKKPPELAAYGGEPLLKGCWPWAETLSALQSADIPATASFDAGSYVCESVYWSALNFKMKHGYPEHISFFHLPALSPQWNQDRLSTALSLALAVVGH